jgi:hypothetical protein
MAIHKGEKTVTDYNLAEESKKIWATLSKLNVNEFTEKKGHLTYLSWAFAYRTMMDHFPDMQITWYTFRDSDNLDRDVLFYPDRTASVHCAVTINGVRREMWLPVMDNRNNAVANPDARAISDTKMRCLVKCFALFGLGLYIFAGSDLPEEEKLDLPSRVQTPEECAIFFHAIDEHLKKLKTKAEMKQFFRTLEGHFSDLKELKDAEGRSAYEDLVKIFSTSSAKAK